MSKGSRDRSKRRPWHSITGGVFLIGLAILFYVGFWPWILVLIGLMAIIEGIGEYYCMRNEEKLT